MRIAIVGGGSAGMITAHFLCRQHEICVFEKEPYLGGQVQTLNVNAPSKNLDKEIIIENGVTGFHYFAQPNFRRLVKQLKIPYQKNFSHITSSLFLNSRQFFEIPSSHTIREYGWLYTFKKDLQLARYLGDFRRTYKRLTHHKDKSVGPNLRESLSPCSSVMEAWFRSTVMLSFSVPYNETPDFPSAKLGKHYKEFKIPCWWHIPGGVYSYIQAILDQNQNNLKHYCNVNIKKVVRHTEGATISFSNGDTQHFDKVIFATSPTVALQLLHSPTSAEENALGPWQTVDFKTVAHTDDSFYQAYHKPSKTQCDYFIKADQTFGYNTYLNHLYRLPKETSYCFAYNLEDRIATDKIIAERVHQVPLCNTTTYPLKAVINKLNGQKHCFYVGAYLGDQLHEGSVTSALTVSTLLGGMKI